MTEYIEREKKGDPFHPNLLLDNIYRRRGLTSMDDLNYDLKNLLKPNFKGIDDAVNVLFDSLKSNDRIMVVGDYDCDGATSTSVAVEGFRMLGFSDVRFTVPDRFTMGYGISPAVVDHFAPQKPDLVVTVDNGISAFEGCAYVKNLKHPTKLVITDHHIGGDEVPVADAIVNPNQVGCPFPSKALAGCGVIFYVLLSLKSKLKNEGWYNKRKEPDLRILLDLVSLGTVADVVPLDKNNRILVWHGLRRINKLNPVRPGIKALSKISNCTIGDITSTDFGFNIGPRINSAGRLDDMTVGINCLLSKNDEESLKYASILQQLNDDRKRITAEISFEANRYLDDLGNIDDIFGLCVHNDNFNEGVIGIVASRLKENYNRPSIVFTTSEDGLYKGSGRSVPGVHLRDILIEVDKKTNKKCLVKYGGHAMAAGMSINPEYFDEFKKHFDLEIKKVLPEIKSVIETDGFLGYNEITLDNAILIKNSGPWGQHFPYPVFYSDFVLCDRRVLKGKHLKMSVKSIDFNNDSKPIDAIYFNCVDEKDVLLPEGSVIRMAFELSINEYLGNIKIQLMVKHMAPLSEFN